MLKRLLVLALFAVLSVASAHAAGAIVQYKICPDDTNFYTAKTCSFTAATTAGNSILAIEWTNAAITSVTGGGNTFVQDITFTGGGVSRLYRAHNAASTTTVTFNTSSQRFYFIALVEVSGLDTTGKDKTSSRDCGYNGGSCTAGTWDSNTTTALAQADEFVIGFAYDSNGGGTTLTEDASFTRIYRHTSNDIILSYKNVSSTTGTKYFGTRTGGSGYNIFSFVVTYPNAAAGPTNRGATETLTTSASVTAPGPTLWEPSGIPNVIMDSDLAENVDDMADQVMAHALMANGEINLVAVVTSSDNVYSAPAAKAIARYYHHNGVLIGAYQGTAFGGETSNYTQQVAARFGSASETRADYPTAVSVMRQALASIPDGTGIIVSGGYFVNLRALLDSTADGYSALNGVDLITAKVRFLACACGTFTSGTEHNLSFDPANANYVLGNWPTQIVYSGFEIGTNITTRPPTASSGLTNALRYAWDCYYNACTAQTTPTATGAWTQSLLLYVARGKGSYYATGGWRGVMTVNSSTGANTWAAASPAGSGNDTYMSTSSYSSIATDINALLAQNPPARRRLTIF